MSWNVKFNARARVNDVILKAKCSRVSFFSPSAWMPRKSLFYKLHLAPILTVIGQQLWPFGYLWKFVMTRLHEPAIRLPPWLGHGPCFSAQRWGVGGRETYPQEDSVGRLKSPGSRWVVSKEGFSRAYHEERVMWVATIIVVWEPLCL